MQFSARGSNFFFVKYGVRPFFARPFFNAQIFFMIFLFWCVFKMKSNNFLVESFFIGIELVIGLAMMFLD